MSKDLRQSVRCLVLDPHFSQGRGQKDGERNKDSKPTGNSKDELPRTACSAGVKVLGRRTLVIDSIMHSKGRACNVGQVREGGQVDECGVQWWCGGLHGASFGCLSVGHTASTR